MLTLLLNFGQSSRNSILTSYLLIQVKYTCSLEQDGHGIVISKKAQETFVAANSFLFPVHSSKKNNNNNRYSAFFTVYFQQGHDLNRKEKKKRGLMAH